MKFPTDSEKKAIGFAVLSCLVFIGLLSVVTRSSARTGKYQRKVLIADSAPASRPTTAPMSTHRPPDSNTRFRVAPANFRGINFATRSYGNYRFTDGTDRELVLVDGQFRDFRNLNNWFDLDDVLYTDLTGDGSPEAIVMMQHIECGRECDGGKNLLYVYSQNYPMEEILSYESGSGMKGCSMKSLTVKNRRLTLEMFGRCPKLGDDAPNDNVIRDTYDVTRVEFFFNGRKLVPRPSTYIRVPNRHEVNYGVEINISDDLNSPPKIPVKTVDVP